MSSTYRAICIAHQPALIPSDAQPTAEAALADARLRRHTECELLVGRWSGGLVEIGCPPTDGHQGDRYHPYGTTWVDATWLRIAALALDADGDQLIDALDHAPRCFSRTRLRLLRSLLIGGE